MFFCAISGEAPQDPVVSTKSGHVYERRLITKYVTENGTDPVTGEKLEEADLITVKASPKASAPRPPTASSIPALLHTLQNEWDALVLETFTLKQQYHNTRQELSYALYAQDAATRVVARLLKERDSAREALASVQASMGITPTTANDVDMTDAAEPTGALPEEVLTKIDETHQALSATRKKRKSPSGYTSPAQVKTFTARHTIPSLHSASPAGITSLAVSQQHPSQFLTGGKDKIVQLYDRGTDKVLASLKGHTKAVGYVAFREQAGEPTMLLSASADKTARIWSLDTASGEYIPRHTVRSHKGELSGLAVHPTSTLAALASLDGSYSLHDLHTFKPVFVSPPSDEPFTCLSVHPDGTLLGLGTSSSTMHIYDIRTGAIAASLEAEGSPFSVNSASFSENGYHLLAPDSTNSVAIWDLRKQKAAHSIKLDGFKVNKVVYDYSAQLLGVAGSEGARIFANKSWDELVRFEEGGEVTGLAFGDQAKEIWGTSGREVRIWGAPA